MCQVPITPTDHHEAAAKLPRLRGTRWDHGRSLDASSCFPGLDLARTLTSRRPHSILFLSGYAPLISLTCRPVKQ